jgi:hypothetical protein
VPGLLNFAIRIIWQIKAKCTVRSYWNAWA